MNNSIFMFPKPENEPVKGYAPGSPERKEIRKALDELYNKVTEIPAIIGGKEVKTFDLFLQHYDSLGLDSLLTAAALEQGVVRDTEKEAAQPERTAHSDRYMWLMLKAQVARNLFGIEYYYKVMKEADPGFQRALELLQ